jgi:hypothetical protein
VGARPDATAIWSGAATAGGQRVVDPLLGLTETIKR